MTSNLLAVTFSNNSLALFSISDGSKNHECWTLPPGEGITCINWSPKGKQLVAGSASSRLFEAFDVQLELILKNKIEEEI